MKMCVYFTFLALANVNSTLTEVKCPLICKCDFYEGFKRATCTNQKLIMIESEVPKESELLDLSFNQITEIGNHIFSVRYVKYKMFPCCNLYFLGYELTISEIIKFVT